MGSLANGIASIAEGYPDPPEEVTIQPGAQAPVTTAGVLTFTFTNPVTNFSVTPYNEDDISQEFSDTVDTPQSDSTGTIWTVNFDPTVDAGVTVGMTMGFSVDADDLDAPAEEIASMPFSDFQGNQIPVALLPRTITQPEADAMAAAATTITLNSGNISAGDWVFDTPGDYNASDPTSRGYYLDTGYGGLKLQLLRILLLVRLIQVPT